MATVDMSFSQSWRAGMRIYDTNLTGTSASETGRAQESQKLNRAGTGKTPAGAGLDGATDRVEFSGTLSRLSRALTTFESRRASRIQTLAAEYQKGNYKPDSLATSRCIVSDALRTGLQ